MPHGYGGRLTAEEAVEINDLFTQLAATVRVKKVRKILEKLNNFLSDMTDGVIARVNWNS